MKKFHVGEDGVPRLCVAGIQDCKVNGGGDANHFPTKEKARDDYESRMVNELTKTLQKSRSAAIQSDESFSEIVIAGVDQGNYVDPVSGVNFVRDADFWGGREQWELELADDRDDSTSFTLDFNDDEAATGALCDEDGETLEYFTMYKSIYYSDNALEHRARVLGKAADMVAHHRPEYTKGNESLLRKIDDYRDGKIELAGVPMRQTSFGAPESWEADYSELPKGVSSLSVRVRHGVATATVQGEDGGYKQVFSESFKTHGGADGAFFDAGFAGKFLTQVEKNLQSGGFGF